MRSGEVINLETADASITTAAVTIKALQVGKKQMTISVFRQLPEAALVDEDTLELVGKPWGYVNYRWGDQRGTNFIFQNGSSLYRTCFLVRDSKELDGGPLPSGYAALHAQAEKWIGYHVYAFAIEGSLPDWYDGYSREVTLCHSLFKGWEFNINIDNHLAGILNHKRRAERGDRAENDAVLGELMAKQTAEVMKRFKEEHSIDMTTRWINMMLHELSGEAADYRSRWDKLMEELRAVEQLYIAV